MVIIEKASLKNTLTTSRRSTAITSMKPDFSGYKFWLAKHHFSPKTINTYASILRRYARGFKRPITPQSLASETDVERIVADVRRSIERGGRGQDALKKGDIAVNLIPAARAYVKFAQNELLSPNQATDWLVYWKKDQIEAAVADRLLDHAASEQFEIVKPGDSLWISGRGKKASLVTIGPLRVLDVVTQAEAEHRLAYQPLKRRYHAMTAPGNETPAREVSLISILHRLRFVSKQRAKLNLAKPLGQQLQRIRQLTPQSAALLRATWQRTGNDAKNRFHDIESKLDGLHQLDEKVTVLRRREQAFLREYLFASSDEGECALCGSRLPINLLVAAHIKRRAECNDNEKRDYMNNVIPVCLFGCDALFERGFIIVDEGKIRARFNADAHPRVRDWLTSFNGRTTKAWKQGRQRYFRWHAKTSYGVEHDSPFVGGV